VVEIGDGEMGQGYITKDQKNGMQGKGRDSKRQSYVENPLSGSEQMEKKACSAEKINPESTVEEITIN
jgi:hypothetical protein